MLMPTVFMLLLNVQDTLNLKICQWLSVATQKNATELFWQKTKLQKSVAFKLARQFGKQKTSAQTLCAYTPICNFTKNTPKKCTKFLKNIRILLRVWGLMSAGLMLHKLHIFLVVQKTLPQK